ncbi:MAG: hypothetical protein HZB62_06170 [Nitrospirae bacterium]|nr:hypothetical protein [Nitrospirota bacterium]
MKKMLFVLVGLSVLLLAAVAFARPWGMGQNTGTISAEQKQFFDATKDLRKEMHDKRFGLMELYRSGADQAKIDALESDIDALRAKIQAKAAEFGMAGGPGACGNQQGANCNMGQGRGQGMGCNGNGPCANQQANAGCGKMGRCGQQ